MKHSISARTVVSIIVPVVVVAIVVGGMAYAVTRDSGGADALTVNGQSVSQVTVNQEIKALTKLPNVTPTSPGAASSDISTGWLTSRVAAVALDQLFVDNHVVLTAAQRTKFVHQLRKQFPGLPQSSENVVIAVSLADSLLSDKLGGSDAVADGAHQGDAQARCERRPEVRPVGARPRPGVPGHRLPRGQQLDVVGRIASLGARPRRDRGSRSGGGRPPPSCRARAALATGSRRFVRTARHPAVAQLAAEGIELESFDESYERAPDLDAAYGEMVRTLLDAATAAPDGDAVVYAVPGNPAVAERTVALLHEAAARGEVVVTVVAGLSFTDLAWARLGVDPMARDARVVDGRAIDDAELSGPLLIAQCDNAFVLSDVKLALLEHLDPATTVTALQRLGLPDERIAAVELADLDRVIEPDHLTSLFVNVETGAARAAREIVRLLQLAKRLRDPGGCPWDAEQTHHSLTRYLLEESYEVVEAVEVLPLDAPGGDVPVPEGAYAALEDELGDLFYEVVFHAVLAEEAGGFTMGDVARGIHDKLVRRHPHVFGDVVADDAAGVVKNWEQIKLEEKGTTSLVHGITPGLPSLLYTNKLFRKAASVGLDPGTADEALTRIDLALARLRADDLVLEDALAQVLAAVVVLARAGGVDPESALRGWAARYRARFEAMERLAAERGLDLAALDAAAVTALWLEAVSRG